MLQYLFVHSLRFGKVEDRLLALPFCAISGDDLLHDVTAHLGQDQAKDSRRHLIVEIRRDIALGFAERDQTPVVCLCALHGLGIDLVFVGAPLSMR